MNMVGSSSWLTKHSLLCFPFILLFPILLSAEWSRVGLAGKEVTALAIRIIWSDTTLLAGTHEGVWRRSFTDTGFKPLRNVSSTDPDVFPLNIHALYSSTTAPTLWAGDDSGLAVYTFTSGLPPVWKRIVEIPAIPVTAIAGSGDTIFCCTASEVYRSFDAGVSWIACSARTFLPMLGNVTRFTSLALFSGIVAGSKCLGGKNSWQGVMSSMDYGDTWTDISNFPGQDKPLSQVFDLLAYTPRFGDRDRLLAVTDDGLHFFFKNNEDTGTWRDFEPRLDGPIPNSLNVNYRTWSLIADLWAGTDSGTFLLFYSSASPAWVRTSSQKTNCVIPNRINDPDRWYAGTDDGIWVYAENTPVIAHKKFPYPLRPNATKRYYSINGRLLNKNKKFSGMVLLRETSGTHEVISKMIGQ